MATGSKTSWSSISDGESGSSGGPGRSVDAPSPGTSVEEATVAGAVAGSTDVADRLELALELSGDNKSAMPSRTRMTFVDGKGGSAG